MTVNLPPPRMAELADVVRFGPFELNRTQKLLFRDGEVVALTPKAFDMLDLFVRNAGSMMEKEALMRGVWPDTFVDEANLSHHVFMLRRALGDEPSRMASTPNCLPIAGRSDWLPPYLAIAPVGRITASSRLLR